MANAHRARENLRDSRRWSEQQTATTTMQQATTSCKQVNESFFTDIVAAVTANLGHLQHAPADFFLHTKESNPYMAELVLLFSFFSLYI